jgi:hypothetical protein
MQEARPRRSTDRRPGNGYDLRFIAAQRDTVMNGRPAAAPSM